MTEFNRRVIAEFRANRGQVGAWGTNLVLIHHRGVKTGLARINPAMSLREGDAWMVVGSAMGAPRDPAWVGNLRAAPDTTIEAVVDDRIEIVPVHASELDGIERAIAFQRFVNVAPAFEAYQARAGRLMPVIRFTRAAPASRA
ncbi:nitroreductase family deazaflavin-dependent oxidoreductase [Agromyces sp. CFH 90414]|uniref:Nitroreductase family deazaflavin-dependent oxidoreductase n=1 Tax=Agromyces agglutinans TaxID=2662258 RepID=A0A6I2F3F8_9MICO|nr:nitroreductase/quinone reductase family protein [Agromyces agglutinans]MRG58924.1 nitroreductase family deazaflavin-dependent oxidoreductase [Agromyces agglutinans]